MIWGTPLLGKLHILGLVKRCNNHILRISIFIVVGVVVVAVVAVVVVVVVLGMCFRKTWAVYFVSFEMVGDRTKQKAEMD